MDESGIDAIVAKTMVAHCLLFQSGEFKHYAEKSTTFLMQVELYTSARGNNALYADYLRLLSPSFSQTVIAINKISLSVYT